MLAKDANGDTIASGGVGSSPAGDAGNAGCESGGTSVTGGLLERWLGRRLGELELQESFEAEVLAATLDAVDEDQLGNEEVLKMWLGFGPEDALPQALKMLVCEFRQQRMMLRISGKLLD